VAAVQVQPGCRRWEGAIVTTLTRAEAVLEAARSAGAFSAVSAEIGGLPGPIWSYARGRLAFDPQSPAVTRETIFDLASLTKVLATTPIAADLVARGMLDLEMPLRDALPEWNSPDREAVTIRDLLEHCSGLPAYREYFKRLRGRSAYVAAIAAEPLEYPPRAKSVYSDLGFIVLGVALERRGGASLDRQFARWRDAARIAQPLDYCPPAEWVARTAMTEHDPWRGRVLQGEVHDENAAALGGVAAHAGLFGTAAAVGEAARWWLHRLRGEDDPGTGITAALARRFVQRSTVPGSSRALGWDTMLPTSSCGSRMSSRAIGHTGFTGTSLWIDPARELYFVLLTNRVHPTRRNEAINEVRRRFHDAAIGELE